MLNFEIKQIGYFNKSQTGRLRQRVVQSIGLFLDGLVVLERYAPNGQLLFRRKTSHPYLYLGLPEVMTNFKFNQQRKNWVIQFTGMPLTFSADMKNIIWQESQHSFTLKPIILLDPRQALYWKTQFEEMRKLYQDATPIKMLEIKLMILECLKFVIKHSEEKTFNSPAMKLKELIDQDIKFASNIDELSRQVGLSRDHIRLLFKKSFYITPQEYRHQLRMNRVNELLENSSLSIKEIADLTGYKYPSHLCKEYKKNFGLTLKQMQDHFYCSGI